MEIIFTCFQFFCNSCPHCYRSCCFDRQFIVVAGCKYYRELCFIGTYE